MSTISDNNSTSATKLHMNKTETQRELEHGEFLP